MTTQKAISVERGCGSRVVGGVYAECGMGPGGHPLEDFIIDPPAILDSDGFAALGVSPRGVTLLEINGVYHILDWVGSENYPNVADFLEEVRRFGLSRRLPRNLDFAKLTAQSRLLLLHARAYIHNFHEYVWGGWVNIKYNRCPTKHPEHGLVEPPLMCAGVWWQDVEGGQPSKSNSAHPRLVHRKMPSFSYEAACRPEGVAPLYNTAIFASFPISRLVVIRDSEGHTHERAASNAGKAALPVELEDE